MKKTLFVLFLLLTLPMSQTVANKIEVKKFQNDASPVLPIEPQKRLKHQQKLLEKLHFTPKNNKKNASTYKFLTWMILSFGSRYLFSNLLMLIGLLVTILAFKISFPLLIGISFLLQLFAVLIFIFYLGNSQTAATGSILAETDEPIMIGGSIFWLVGCVFFEMLAIGYVLNMSGLLLWGMILFVLWLVFLSI